MKLWEKASLMDLNDLKNLSEDELRRYARSAVNSARARARELEEAKLSSYSDAYKAMEHGGRRGKGMFTLSGKSTQKELLWELRRATGFLEAKTSTIEGAESRRQWMVNKFGTDDWKVVGPILDRYHELMNSKSELGQKLRDFLAAGVDSNRIIDITHKYRNGSEEDMIKELERVDYENKKALRNRFN